jgi:pimeloyl-ACP methyl ester carboxylesterase
VQSLDVEGAWAQINVPVLVVHGEYDWIMSRAEADHVLEIVNARHAGRATLAWLPRTDHNLEMFATPLDAYNGQAGQFDPAVIDRVAEWLRENVPATATGAR